MNLDKHVSRFTEDVMNLYTQIKTPRIISILRQKKYFKICFLHFKLFVIRAFIRFIKNAMNPDKSMSRFTEDVTNLDTQKGHPELFGQEYEISN